MSKLIMLDTEEILEDMVKFLILIYEEPDAYENEEYLKLNYMDRGIIKPNFKMAFDILTILVENSIESRTVLPVSKKKEPLIPFHLKIMGILYNLNPKDIKEKQFPKVVKYFDDKLIYPVLDRLAPQVSNVVPSGNYNTWTIIPIGKNIGLVQGEDFRITEYYRLTKETREDCILRITLSPVIDFLMKEMEPFGLTQRLWLDCHGIHRNINIAEERYIVINRILERLSIMYPCFKIEKSKLLSLSGFPELVTPDSKISTLQYYMYLDNKVNQILENYSSYVFDKVIDKSIQYEAEIDTEILVINQVDKISEETKEEDYKRELAYALINGDYLPPDERMIAEAFYQDNIREFI